MKSRFGIPTQSIDTIVGNLNVLLADIHQLYIKNLGYHWNVQDPRFYQLHQLFEAGYEELASNLDLVAERIRKLGRLAPQSIKELSEAVRLQDTQPVNTAQQMIDLLACDYESLLIWLREDIDAATDLGDFGTADMLTELLRQYEKRAWFLRSHLTESSIE